jgi:hypothetical protein
MRGDAPKSLGDVLGQSRTLNNRRRISWHNWRGVVGSRIANRSRPEYLDRQTLTVTVASSVWAQELSLLQSTIIERLREQGHPVHHLQFRVGEVKPPATRKLPPQVSPEPLPPQLERRLDAVDDEQLKRAIAHAAGYSLARSKQRT